MEKKAVNRRAWIIIGVAVILLAVLSVGVLIISRGSADRDESLLDLGQRYLDEMNYEQAIVCFEEYLEIDPQCVEAYLGLAQAYAGLDEYEKALEVLASGYAATRDKSLMELSSQIEEQYREQILAKGGTDTTGGTDGDRNQGQDTDAEDTEQKEAAFYLMKESRYTNGELVYAIEYEYDANGNVVEEVYYSADGSVSNRHVYENEYTAKGDLQKTTCYNAEKEILNWTEYKYRSNGEKEQVIRHFSNSRSEIKEYDTDGNLVNNTGYNSDGSISSVHVYEYDADGNMSSKRERYYRDDDMYILGIDNVYEEYDSDDRIISRTSYYEDDSIARYEEFDLNGNVEREVNYFRWEDICIVQNTMYEYGDDGSKVSAVVYDEEGKVDHRIKYEIGEDGIMHVTAYDSDGNEEYTFFEDYSNYGEYDTEGYLVREYVNGSRMPVKREYDENGNIVRIVASDGSGNELERYEYEYLQIP